MGTLPQSSSDSGSSTTDGSTSSSTTTTTVPGGSTSTTVPSTGDETVDQLIALAQQALIDADAALAAGDLGAYQAKVNEAQDYIDRANVLLSSSVGHAADDGAVHHRPDDHDRRHARLGRAGRSAPQRSGVPSGVIGVGARHRCRGRSRTARRSG